MNCRTLNQHQTCPFSQEKIVDMQCDILISNLKNPKTIALMKENIGNMSDGSSSYCGGALKLGFKKAFELKKQERSAQLQLKKREEGVKLQCSSQFCGWRKQPVSYLTVGSNPRCSKCLCYFQCTGCKSLRTSSFESCQSCGKMFI